MRKFAISICLALCTVQFTAQTREARLVDAFERVPCGDITGRLDSLIAEWIKNKDEQLVVVYYSARYRRNSEFRGRDRLVTVLSYPHHDDGLNWAKGIPKYLLARTAGDLNYESLGKRTGFIDGGFREDVAAELWLVPPGAERPKPEFSTISVSDVKFNAKRPLSIPDYFNCYAGF